MTTASNFKQAVRTFAKATGTNYTEALRSIEAGDGYPLSESASGFYYSIHGFPGDRELCRRLDFVTDPLTTPQQIHEHIMAGPNDVDVHSTVTLRPDLLPETLHRLAQYVLIDGAELRVAENPATELRTLVTLARGLSTGEDACIAITVHPNADKALLERMARVVKNDIRYIKPRKVQAAAMEALRARFGA